MGKITAAGVVALCAAPTAALNVWPRVPQILAGAATGSDVGFVILVIIAALLMAAVPYAAHNARTIA